MVRNIYHKEELVVNCKVLKNGLATVESLWSFSFFFFLFFYINGYFVFLYAAYQVLRYLIVFNL